MADASHVGDRVDVDAIRRGLNRMIRLIRYLEVIDGYLLGLRA